MSLPTLREMVKEVVRNTIYGFSEKEVSDVEIEWLLNLSDKIRNAAVDDAETHLAWGRLHGGLEHCQLPYERTEEVLGQLYGVLGKRRV